MRCPFWIQHGFWSFCYFALDWCYRTRSSRNFLLPSQQTTSMPIESKDQATRWMSVTKSSSDMMPYLEFDHTCKEYLHRYNLLHHEQFWLYMYDRDNLLRSQSLPSKTFIGKSPLIFASNYNALFFCVSSFHTVLRRTVFNHLILIIYQIDDKQPFCLFFLFLSTVHAASSSLFFS